MECLRHQGHRQECKNRIEQANSSTHKAKCPISTKDCLLAMERCPISRKDTPCYGVNYKHDFDRIGPVHIHNLILRKHR